MLHYYNVQIGVQRANINKVFKEICKYGTKNLTWRKSNQRSTFFYHLATAVAPMSSGLFLPKQAAKLCPEQINRLRINNSGQGQHQLGSNRICAKRNETIFVACNRVLHCTNHCHFCFQNKRKHILVLKNRGAYLGSQQSDTATTPGK